MKEYSTGLFGLFLIFAVFLYSTIYVIDLGREEIKRSDEAKLENAQAVERLKATKLKRVQKERGNKAVDDFIKSWEPHTARKESEILNQEVQEIVNNFTILSFGKKSSVRPNYLIGGQLIEVLEFSLNIKGEFTRVFNFLGKLEETYPFARFSSVNAYPSDDTVSVAFTMQFPRFPKTHK